MTATATTLRATLLALLACASSLAPVAKAQQDVFTIRAKQAWIQPERTADGVTIEITKGKIAALRDGTNVVDGREANARSFATGVVTAGFVDAHRTPLAENGIGEDAESFTPELAAIFAYDPWSVRWTELQQRGVTSAVLAGGNENVGAGQGAFVKSGRPATADEASSYLKFSLAREAMRRDRRPTSLLGALEILRGGYASLEGRPGTALTATQRTLVSTIGGARRVAIAARERREILAALEFLATWQLQGCIVGGDEAATCLEELARDRTPVLLEPLRTDASRKALDLPLQLAARRIPFAFTNEGTDKHAGSALQWSMALAVREGLAPAAALAAVTTTPATIAGRSDQVGSLQIGRDADLIVWSGQPWDLRSRILLVVQDGAIVFEAATPSSGASSGSETEKQAR